MTSLRSAWRVAVVLGSLLSPIAVPAAVLEVPAQYPSIQLAIDAAASGDVVRVDAGVYFESLDFKGKMISVESTTGAESTIIDAGGNGPVVQFVSGETRSAVLRGFTVRNGSNPDGGGIRIRFSSPVISANRIVDNVGCSGVGVDVYFGSPLIDGNVIAGNRSKSYSGCRGGGVHVGGSGTAEIIRNDIRDNVVDASGGGIQLNAAGAPVIRDNRIFGNMVSYGYGGAISAFNDTDAEIVQNEIAFNRATHGGGAIHFSVPSGTRGPRLVNNTIAWNESPNGAALLTEGFDARVEVVNNILVAAYGPAVSCETYYDYASPLFRSNDIWAADGAPATGGLCALAETTNSNISADPVFFTATNADFRLSPASPCVDSGDRSVAGLTATDIAGAPRVADGRGTGLAAVDMGAHEYDGATLLHALPEALDFGAQLTGTFSSPVRVTFTNAGTAPVVITGVLIAGEFSATDDCVREGGLAPAATCTAEVVFAPTVRGPQTGQLEILAEGTVVLRVPLSGRGVAAAVDIQPPSIDFGSVNVGRESVPRAVTVTNVGEAPLTVAGATVTGAFEATVLCGPSLAPGASCTVWVTFEPQAKGWHSGLLVVQTDAPAQPDAIALSGRATQPRLHADGPVAFGQVVVGLTMLRTTTVQNLGDGPLTLESMNVTGSDFSLESTTCAGALAPGASCSASVRFTPSARATRSGTIEITSDTPERVTAAISGEGIAALAALTPSALAFGQVKVGKLSAPMNIVVKNVGNAVLTVNAVLTQGEFATSHTCTAPLGPGATCVATVTFKPTVRGVANGNLTLVSNSLPSAPVIPLSGEGVTGKAR